MLNLHTCLMYNIHASMQSGDIMNYLKKRVFFISTIIAAILLSQPILAQPVQVVSEYRLTPADLAEMTERFSIDILAGYNNVYRCQGFQYQINFLKCSPAKVSELVDLLQQIAPRSTLARTSDGVFEVITVDSFLARSVLLNLEDISVLERGKLIPLQLPLEWLITAETFTSKPDIELLNKSHQNGIVEVFNQIIRTGAVDRVQVNYILCMDLASAERVFSLRFTAAKHPRSVKRIGKLVIEVIATNPETVGTVMNYFE